MSFLPGLGRKAAVAADVTGGNPRAFPVNAYQVGRAYKPNWNIDRAIRDGLERVVTIFRCIDAIASNQLRLPVRVRLDDRETGEPVADHFVSQWMNGFPNPYEDSATFRYKLSAQLLLSKKGAFGEIIRSNMGDPIGLYLLPPQYTSPVPSATKYVEKFVVELPGGQSWDLAAEDVVWWRGRPHPTDPFLALTPLESAGLSADIDWYAKLYNRRFLQNDGRPGGILGVKGDIDDDGIKEVRNRFSGSPEQAGRIAVINADDMWYEDTAINPRDAQWIELTKANKDEIREAFGVPESLHNASGRTFDNAGQEKLNFWEETMETHVVFLERPLDRLDGDPSTFVDFDSSGVPVIQKAKQERESGLRENVKIGVMTPEEMRGETGRDPSGDPSLDEFYMPATMVPVGARTVKAGNRPKVSTARSNLNVSQ